MALRALAVRAGHRFIDAVLRVDRRAVLNPSSGSGPRLEDALPGLRRFLAAGRVDYARLGDDPAYRQYRDAVAALRQTGPPSGIDAATAWWINLYNGLIIHAVIAFRIRRSALWDDLGFFRRAAYVIDGRRMSADDIEHGILRGNRGHPFLLLPQFAPGDPRGAWSLPVDPRVHFTLVCAANSCPAINFYSAEKLDAQLDMAAAAFITGGGVHVDDAARTLTLSRIFKWYARDFGGRAGVLRTIARYLPDDARRDAIARPGVRIRYQRYDWSLNHLRSPAGQ